MTLHVLIEKENGVKEHHTAHLNGNLSLVAAVCLKYPALV